MGVGIPKFEVKIVSDIIQGLNPEQRAAVINFNDPSLIIAGAGSGKTRVLTSRIAYMLECGVDPRSIMALTFTNKAAKQMRERLEEVIGATKARAIVMGTFHSVFLRILYENAELLGYSKNFNIYQPSDAKNLIKTIVKELKLPDDRYKPNTMLSRISLAKNSLITEGAYQANTAYISEDRQAKIDRFSEVYSQYCRRCKGSDAMDFDDLLLQTNILFRDHPEVLARYQNQFQYLLVDEFQDTNYAQYIIVRRLSQLHGRVCVVGDDSQSIYSFRGAKIENILNFRNHFPKAKTFKLEQNYRSTRTIVDAANSLIEHNRTRLDKKCFSQGEVGEKIGLFRSASDRDEAFTVVRDIEKRVREGAAWGEFAILYRTNSQSQAIEQAMMMRSIPYQVYRGNSFYEHKEIKDVLAYVRLVVNQRDDEALKRVINYPARGIGATTLDRIEELAKSQGSSMWSVIDTLSEESATDSVQRAIVRKVKEFVALIRELVAIGNNSDDPISLYDYGLMVAQRSGILPLFRLSSDPESQSAVENIEELLNSMQQFSDQRAELVAEIESNEGEMVEDEESEESGAFDLESLAPPTLEEWLRNVMLLTDQDNAPEDEGQRVTMMTVHVSKGLEFDYVYTIGMERGLFPSQRAVEMGEIDEERRLFYVALTRAKRAAILSYCDSRFKWGKTELSYPSMFLKEIDLQYIDINDKNDFRRASRDVMADEDSRPSRGFNRGTYRGGGSSSSSSAGDNRVRQSAERSYERGSESRPTNVAAKPANMRSLGSRVKVESADGNSSVESKGGYVVGDRIMHDRFGKGRVEEVAMVGVHEMLTVQFESTGESKKIVVKLAPIRKIE